MNIAFNPWIPVVTTMGKPDLASLSAVLTEGERFSDLSVRPHERVALMRFLICVAHAALDGPKNYDEWCRVRELLPGRAAEYLSEWNKGEKSSWELFHPTRPWLQVKELKGDIEKASPVAFLDFELATGNTTTLFDHQGTLTDRKIDPERTALNLLTFLNFSPGGGSPIARWKDKKTLQVGNPDAPCLSQSMAHCLFRGKNLAETLHFNLPSYDRINMVYRVYSHDKKAKKSEHGEISFGRPVWECFPDSPDDSNSVMNATQTYIGRLVPISRWVRLLENTNRMYCCNGFKYATYREGFPAEPTAAVQVINRKDKKGAEVIERRVVGIKPDKATWRELSALLTKRASDGLGGPIALDNAPHDNDFDFHVCAMIRDQASMDIGIESVFHIKPLFQSNLAVYADEVEHSERYSRRLRRAIDVYRNCIDADWNSRIKRTPAKDQAKLRNRLAQVSFLSYWTNVEKNLPLLMAHIEAIGNDKAVPAREAWRKMLFSSACEAYCTACGRETPRQIQAFIKGWQKLTAIKNDGEPDTNDNKEEEA